MNIFIDGISKPGVLITFDNSRQIIDSEVINIGGRESRIFPGVLDTFIQHKVGGYKNLEKVFLVNGPGSFTGIRSMVLVVNTLKYIFPKIQLTPISFFELFENFPVVKSSSKKDVFFKIDSESFPEILTNEQLLKKCLEEQIKTIYGETISDLPLNFENRIDYDKILQTIGEKDVPYIEPLYLKKPNIT